MKALQNGTIYNRKKAPLLRCRLYSLPFLSLYFQMGMAFLQVSLRSNIFGVHIWYSRLRKSRTSHSDLDDITIQINSYSSILDSFRFLCNLRRNVFFLKWNRNVRAGNSACFTFCRPFDSLFFIMTKGLTCSCLIKISCFLNIVKGFLL